MKTLNLSVKNDMLSMVNLVECLYDIIIKYKIATYKEIYLRAYFNKLFFNDKER